MFRSLFRGRDDVFPRRFESRKTGKITRAYERVFDDADSVVEDAIEEARKLLDVNRGELQRAKGKIGELDRKIGSMTRLLVDPDIEATAKKAVSRQIGELEA